MDLANAEWIKSSYSGPEGGECVECSPSFIAVNVVPVRDSKGFGSPALLFPDAQWAGFVSAVKSGEL